MNDTWQSLNKAEVYCGGDGVRWRMDIGVRIAQPANLHNRLGRWQRPSSDHNLGLSTTIHHAHDSAWDYILEMPYIGRWTSRYTRPGAMDRTVASVTAVDSIDGMTDQCRRML